MAHRPDIDLVTLETVHRLLSDTDFASADDLVSQGGLGGLDAAIDRGRSAAPVTSPASAPGQDPLPRRR